MIVYVAPGETRSVVLPYSEVCMYLQVAGRRMRCEIQAPDGRSPAVQLLDDDGRPFSFPITLGEAGFHRDGQGRIYTES
ncbi:hypothetical protein ACG83_41305 [Frankia sp. R43]|uniref:hypothetical protein n=1 Tax=Frankia sp. R43 TaxID=269536 RepID=UPI0006C9F9CF|nr:hypothetical protein [Frankia sp. R43]KPM50259.1 hypothetical protein ACG83_41305 [Frankia sp. R43]